MDGVPTSAVSPSLSLGPVDGADRLAPDASVIERQQRDDLQTRMDRELVWWNGFSRVHLSPTDEFGTL